MSVKSTFRPALESLEDRISPATALISEGGVATLKGTLAVTPAAQALPQTIQIHQQVSQVTLPGGDVLPGHGLKTAGAQTPVVNWAPTGPA